MVVTGETTPKPASKHHAVREQLRSRVLTLSPGQRLPPERELAEEIGVARMTLRQAIAGLVTEGVVRTEKGRGNFRAEPPLTLRLQRRSFSDTVRAYGIVAGNRPLDCSWDLDPPQAALDFLQPGPDVRLRRVKRLRLGNGEPLAVSHAWFPDDRVPGLTMRVASGSLWIHLRSLGLEVDGLRESVRVGLPTEDEADLLALSPARPVLRLVRRASAAGVPVEYTEAVFAGDRFELELH